MNKRVVSLSTAAPLVTKRGAGNAPKDCLDKARLALDEVMAEAYEAGDGYALRVLHSVAALLAATRHESGSPEEWHRSRLD